MNSQTHPFLLRAISESNLERSPWPNFAGLRKEIDRRAFISGRIVGKPETEIPAIRRSAFTHFGSPSPLAQPSSE